MIKVLKSEKVRDLLTIDIDGQLQNTVIGQTIKDDNGNHFLLQSVALQGGVSTMEIQTLVVTPIGAFSMVGAYIIE